METHLALPNGKRFIAKSLALGGTDYRGRTYSRFEPQPSYVGTGWEVVGHADNVSADVIARAARPDRPASPARGYAGLVTIGWKHKSDAQAVADYLNGKEAA